MSCFSYSGIITAKTGTYESKYEVIDQETGEILPVTITIYVHSSSEARFYKFDLKKAQNSVLTKDVEGQILEDTIILQIPKGTDVTSLKPEIDYASSAGTTLEYSYWNGTIHDFTTPVKYVLTAPDGKTKKTYTVKVEFYDPDNDFDNDNPSKDDPGKDREEKDNQADDVSKKDPIQPPTDSSSSNKINKLSLPRVGTKITYKNGIYQILSIKGHNKTVKFVKPTKKSIKTYKIPSTIKYKSNTYKVTQIAPKAFYKCKKLKRITLPSTITKIGKKAFYKCNKKAKIYVPKKKYKKYRKWLKKYKIQIII